MKLKFYKNKKQEKIYTLKSTSPENTPTNDAHYKFLKLRDIKN